ncbi:MAG: DUF4827 family protein [Muribaculaceae bacterium]|nr:DUF4827 family protein [Muribaculaceae bacterium]
MKRFFYDNRVLLLAMTVLMALTACDDNESYADKLNEERNAVNAYLANHRLVMSVPEDTVFEVGENAPFYRIDPDGNVYMQVLKPGDRINDRAKTSEPIYFRYSRYNLATWYADGTWTITSGNENTMDASSCSFNYLDYTLPSSSQWGYGLQYPLLFLGVECEVNLIIKSQYGFTSELSYVTPFFFHVRYYHSQI